jgi:ketosteroid isomerase-like protein
MNKQILSALLLVLPLLTTASCIAGEAPSQHGSRSIMVTREVKQFGDLERDLIAAINAKDADAMKQLLADDFTLHSGNTPGDPTNRTEMIAQAIAGRAYDSRLEHVSALEYGNVVVVSFSWNLDGVESQTSAQKVFVVDTWKRVDEHWKLAVRYASAVIKSDMPVPGFVPHALAPNKKI